MERNHKVRLETRIVLEVGDTVRLSDAGKQRWCNDETNPHNLIGKVTSEYHHIYVKWANRENNCYNCYNCEDLEYISPVKAEPTIEARLAKLEYEVACLLVEQMRVNS